MKPVIVVEGTSDVNRLQNIVDADFVITNGSCVSRETIDYLQNLSLNRTIILLLDPDYPGMRIRSILNQALPNALNAYVDRNKSIKGHKLGVCECEKEEIIRALNQVYEFNVSEEKNEGTLTLDDLIELNLTLSSSASSNREKLSKKLPIGKVNSKTLLKRLNQLNISKEQIIDILENEDDSK